MDGGASRPPFMRPASNQKRSFSTMAASHRHESSPPVRDEHYENEHAARRRRFEAELRPARLRFSGDGLDFRRPVMSTPPLHAAGPAEREAVGNDMNGRAPVIDLTDDDAFERPRGSSRYITAATLNPGHARESRAERNVIDLESSGEEADDVEGYDTAGLPGATYLALPPRRVPSQHPFQRRAEHHRRSPPVIMDDVQFIEHRQLGPSRQASNSLPGTPRPQRTVTPYPRQNETIDLTEDDDEVVHLDTRQREGLGRRDGVNLAPPEITAGVGTRTVGGRGFQHVGEIVNLLREGGAQLGGRLYQRVQDFAAGPGLLDDLRQPLPPLHAVRRGATNGPPPAPRHHHQVHHHHHHHHRTQVHAGRARLYAAHAMAQALGVQNDMANLMDYHMTGFGLNTGQPARPPTPKYEPPAAAAEGFTHSPKEGEIVVCPNCGDELAMGDDEVKREVWVVKACGHAYCGECARNRGRSTNKKGKKGKAPVVDDSHLPQPFKTCVVPGCGKPTARTSMIHVYLGS